MQLARILHALQGYVQSQNRVFEVLFPQFQSRFMSSYDVVFEFWVVKIPSPVFGRLFDFHVVASFLQLPYSILCRARTILPVSAFNNTFVDRLAKGMPISVN